MIDLAPILSRIFRPDRPRFDEVRAAVRGLAGGREAWERLRTTGAIPAAWAGEARRRFHPMRAAGLPHRHGNCCKPCLCCRDFLLTEPRSAHDAIVFASDVEGIEAAEALTRKGMRRLTWWGESISEPIVWGISRGSTRFRRFHVNALRTPRYKVQAALGLDIFVHHVKRAYATLEASHDREPRRAGESPREMLADLLALHYSWVDACARGLSVPGRAGGLSPVEGQPFAALDDPFEPWLALFATGYAPWAISEDGALLAAPAFAP